MKKHLPISDEERFLFQESVKGVKPLKKSTTISVKSNPDSLIFKSDQQYRSDLSPVFNPFTLPDLPFTEQVRKEARLYFMRPGLQHRVMKRLQENFFVPQVTLDLHGFSILQAGNALTRFLENAVQNKIRYVEIIHGKSIREGQEFPILKNKVNVWLREHPYVMGFCSAPSMRGGTGTVYVRLSSRSLKS